MRSMTVIDVLCGNYRNVTYHTPIQISTNAHVLPQIKRLEVLGLCDDNICSYVVQVFPNLELINLSAMVIRNAITGSLLSTEVAIQFLKYVLRIPTFTVNYIRVKNLERVLMEFYDQKRMIKKLCIQFRQVDEIRSSSEVSVKTYGKGEIHMCISYGKESTKIILSRIGIIEKNGDNFKCNNIDMGFDFDEIRLLDNRGDSDSISSILRQCPNLKNINIARTFFTRTKDTVYSKSSVELFADGRFVFIRYVISFPYY